MVHCPNCGVVKALPVGHPALKGLCKICLQGTLAPVSINMETRTFETPTT